MIGVKGAKMPTRCAGCPEEFYYEHLGGYLCGQLDKPTDEIDVHERWERRLDGCPLVEIVTCGECAIGRRKDSLSGKYCEHIGRITEDDFFCAYGTKALEQGAENEM